MTMYEVTRRGLKFVTYRHTHIHHDKATRRAWLPSLKRNFDVTYAPLPIIPYFTTMQHPTYLVVYMFWMKILLVELAPYIAIAVLNLALINK